MGHTNDETVQYYISGLVGLDSQSMVRGREQRLELISENTSMMLKRNLLAPKPPGSQLTDLPFSKEVIKNVVADDYDIMTVPALTPAQEYDIRRKSRKKAYNQKRNDFFSGTGESPKEGSSAFTPSRSPSRYLQALWKFEPDRKKVVESVYNQPSSKVDLPLQTVLEPMIKMANPGISRWSYKSAEPTSDNSCPDCKKKLKTLVSPYHYIMSLLTNAGTGQSV